MRKNILSLSIATMIGGLVMTNAAHANVVTASQANLGAVPWAAGIAAADSLNLAAGGIGHQLITPYFTVQNGNATVLSIVNTDQKNGKAVKIRFRSGSNSDDILDFQVYMSPADHWSALISKNPTTGLAQLTTNDNTCTLPALTPGVAQSFITGRLPSYATATELANLTAEGYVEIFNMADIPKNTTDTKTLYSTILHSAGKPACNSGVLGATLTDITTEGAATTAGFAAPTTGLFGNWTIINVPQTTTFSGSMTAVRAVVAATGKDGYGNFVLFPQNDAGATSVDLATADPLFRATSYKDLSTAGVTTTSVGKSIAAANYDLPDMSTPYLPFVAAPAALSTASPLTMAGAITSALAVTSISNEYSTDSTVNASTDWTFSMPTRRYSVAMSYGTAATAGFKVYSIVNSTLTANPFFSDNNVSNGTGGVPADRLCVSATKQSFWDREEGGKSAGAVFSPGSVAVFRFCGEDSVTTFGSAPSVLGATLAVQNTGSSAFASGWGLVDTSNTTNAFNIGLPILGSAFIKLSNPQAAAGVSGTYGITSDHRFVQAR